MSQYLEDALKFLRDKDKVEKRVTKQALRDSKLYQMTIGLTDYQVKKLAENDYYIDLLTGVRISFVYRCTMDGWVYLILASVCGDNQINTGIGYGTTYLTVLSDSWRKLVIRKLSAQ